MWIKDLQKDVEVILKDRKVVSSHFALQETKISSYWFEVAEKKHGNNLKVPVSYDF